MSEYIRTNKFDTNECLNIFVKEKLIPTNVRIYIRDQYTLVSNIFIFTCMSFSHEDNVDEDDDEYENNAHNDDLEQLGR